LVFEEVLLNDSGREEKGVFEPLSFQIQLSQHFQTMSVIWIPLANLPQQRLSCPHFLSRRKKGFSSLKHIFRVIVFSEFSILFVKIVVFRLDSQQRDSIAALPRRRPHNKETLGVRPAQRLAPVHFVNALLEAYFTVFWVV